MPRFLFSLILFMAVSRLACAGSSDTSSWFVIYLSGRLSEGELKRFKDNTSTLLPSPLTWQTSESIDPTTPNYVLVYDSILAKSTHLEIQAYRQKMIPPPNGTLRIEQLEQMRLDAWVEVRNIDGDRMGLFPIGTLSGHVSANANPQKPASYILGTHADPHPCLELINCLKALVQNESLQTIQSYHFVDWDLDSKRFASTQEILRYLLIRSLRTCKMRPARQKALFGELSILFLNPQLGSPADSFVKAAQLEQRSQSSPVPLPPLPPLKTQLPLTVCETPDKTYAPLLQALL